MKRWAILTLLTLGLTTASSAPSFACACCGTWQVKNVASWDVLNIRNGPSARYSKVGSIPSGSACVIKSGPCQNSWCHVSYAEMDGWVNTRYLRFKK